MKKIKMKKDIIIKIIFWFFFLFVFMILSFILMLSLNVENDFINSVYAQHDYKYPFLENYDLNKLNEKEFIKLVKSNYEYTKEKDCKYWSYLYYNYFKLKGYDVKYIYNFQIKHVFVVASKDSHYYFLDNYNIEKFVIKVD